MKLFIVKLILLGTVTVLALMAGNMIRKSLQAAFESRRQQIELIVPDVRPSSAEVA